MHTAALRGVTGESQRYHIPETMQDVVFLVLGSRIDLNRLGMDLVGISARLGRYGRGPWL